MKEIKNQRGFALIEFAIALPLLILLLHVLGSVSLSAWKISREQVADYVLETEAQEVIERITTDARAAYEITIKKNGQRVIFMCHTQTTDKLLTFENVQDTRIYDVHTPKNDVYSHVYFKHTDDEKNYTSPITGKSSYGETFIKRLEFSALTKNVLHITLEMDNKVTGQMVKLSTAVFAPACPKIIDTRYPDND